MPRIPEASSEVEPRLDGRVCLLTGATAGIGGAAAVRLASLGADLVLVGRRRSRLDATINEIRRATPGARVRGIVADLSSQADVRRLAAQVLAQCPALHLLINNAAVVTKRRDETIDGIERQLAVNHLAPFLLTNLLLERIIHSAPARIIMVASQVERGGEIDFNDLQGRVDYDRWRAYRQSKLANILFANELARRVEGTGVTLISLHPGVYTTRLLDALMGWSSLLTKLRGRGLPGPEAGAEVLAHAAVAPKLTGNTPLYLHERTVSTPSARARDPMLARALWGASAKLTGLPE